MTHSLDEKIGQMIIVGFSGSEAGQKILHKITANHIGGVWLSDQQSPMGNIKTNIQAPQQVKNLITELQSAATIPLFTTIDAEGGKIIRLKKEFGFPATLSPKELGNKDDPAFTYKKSQELAKLLKDLGFNFNFAPVVDLNIASNNPALCGKNRCFSRDPGSVYQHARAFIKSHREKNILCCLKHFPGHGSTPEDTHNDWVDASDCWQEEELIPYKKLIKDNLADSILAAHLVIDYFDPHYPASLSRKLLTGFLKESLNYKGLILSDDLIMGAVNLHFSYEKAVELAINAGTDLLMNSCVNEPASQQEDETFTTIKKLVADGKISEERIDHSFQKIMSYKRKLL